MNEQQRLLARKRAEDESKRADLKQHADKLIQGFEKLGESDAKRAIWELFQNALDLADHCEIEIQLKEDSIDFSHNGEPFVSKTLTSLIKQVSSKNGQNNDEEIGQYGTGFITSHSFGYKILLSGSIQEGDEFIELDEFEIDRVVENSDTDALIEKLLTQQNAVYDLVEKGELRSTKRPFTTFSYQTQTPKEKLRAKTAIEGLYRLLPFVMVLNDNLQKVTVIDKDQSKTVFRRGQTLENEGLHETQIIRNEVVSPVYYLKENEGRNIMILPLSSHDKVIHFEKFIPRLFLHFPLIGSESFGLNFVMHSKDFAPTEPRDGVHLSSDNDQVAHKEESNRGLVNIMSDRILEFVRLTGKSLANPIHFASLDFPQYPEETPLFQYYSALRNKWVSGLKSIELVETTNQGCIQPKAAQFVSSDLLKDENCTKSIFNVISKFWQATPKEDLIRDWTDVVLKWGEQPDFTFITIDMLLNKIQTVGKLEQFDAEELKSLYQYLIEQGHSDVFDKYKLLPNIEGVFVSKSELFKKVNLHSEHIVISKLLIKEKADRFYDSSFGLALELSNYSRKDLSKDLNARILSFDQELTTGKPVPQLHIANLIRLCSIQSIDGATNKRKEITKCICEFYGKEYHEVVIPNIDTDKLDFDTPIKGLIKLVVKDFINNASATKTHVESNLDFLKDLIQLVDGYHDYRDVLKSFKIFPNQNYQLCLSNELLKESDFPNTLDDKEYLKDIYKKKCSDIRVKLLHPNFSFVSTITNEKKAIDLSTELDNLFQKNGSFDKILSHPDREVMLDLVQKTTNSKEWAELFKIIHGKRATIMMGKISDPDIKNNLFKIIRMDKRKIQILGELADNVDLEEIIRKGKEALEEQRRQEDELNFKYKIGTHLEDLIRERIGMEVEDFEATVSNVQGGQDIIVRLKGEILMYIEVKSRWDSRNSITMSPTQMRKSANNADRYNLLCVDMCDYHPQDGGRHEVDDITLILDRIKAIVDIGLKTKPLIENALNITDYENEVTLSGDYRATVPQALIKNEGIDFASWVDKVIAKIKSMEVIPG